MSFTFEEKEFYELMNLKNSYSEFDLPNDLGKFTFNNKYINEDISLFHSTGKFKKNIAVRANAELNGTFFIFIIDGSYSIKSNVFTLQGTANHTNVATLSEIVESEVRYLSENFNVLGLYVSNTFIGKYFGYTQPNNTLVKHAQTLWESQACIAQILQNPYNDSLNKIFIESKVLELLFYEFRDMRQDKEDSSKVIFTEEDKWALEKARGILASNIANPPSIKELSKQSKINEFKLKFGFKKFYNQTPYNFIKEKRMLQARALLETSEYNINEISSQVGYKQPGCFSKNFYKYFGVLPKEIIKKRKYYY